MSSLPLSIVRLFKHRHRTRATLARTGVVLDLLARGLQDVEPILLDLPGRKLPAITVYRSVNQWIGSDVTRAGTGLSKEGRPA